MAVEWAESFVGKTVRVLFERRTPAGRLTGYTDRYVPVLKKSGKPGTVTYFLLRKSHLGNDLGRHETGDCP